MSDNKQSLARKPRINICLLLKGFFSNFLIFRKIKKKKLSHSDHQFGLNKINIAIVTGTVTLFKNVNVNVNINTAGITLRARARPATTL